MTKLSTLARPASAAAALLLAALLLPSQAFAAPAQASASANVRSGPGTSYRVVDRLRRGERVEVQGCRDGWCYITHPGPDGYVSASYLRRNGNFMERNFNLTFKFPNWNTGGGTGNPSPGGNTPPQGGNGPSNPPAPN